MTVTESTRRTGLATTEEVADFLRMTPGGLTQLRLRGTGPQFMNLGTRSVRYDWADVYAWLDSKKSARSKKKAKASA